MGCSLCRPCSRSKDFAFFSLSGGSLGGLWAEERWHEMAWGGMRWDGMAWGGMVWGGTAWHGLGLTVEKRLWAEEAEAGSPVGRVLESPG